MSILIDEDTRVVIQGITGKDGSFHAKQMLDYGTKVVAGVVFGKGGRKVEGVPVFNTMEEATARTRANTSIIFVPRESAVEALFEAGNSSVRLIICITEGIPVLDMIRVSDFLKRKKIILVGPNCPGVISPGKSKVGIMPGGIFKKGFVGMVSRSGSLTYEIADCIARAGFGVSTCVGIGGDPIGGLIFVDCLKMFRRDPETKAIVLIGEIGGSGEEEAAEYVNQYMRGSVAAPAVIVFIAGKTAPPGRQMGHAGAIILGKIGTAEGKAKAFARAGVAVAENPSEVGELLGFIFRKQ